MKVLMAGQNFHVVGGSDRVFFDEIRLLEEYGHQIAPFCAQSELNLPTQWSKFFPIAASFDSPGVLDVMRYVYSASSRKGIEALLSEFSPDVAHLHIYYGKLTASILKPLRDRGIPVVQTLHEYKVVCPTYLLTSNGEFCESCSGFQFYNAALNKCNRSSLVRSIISTVESYVSLALGSVDKIDHFIAVSDFLRGQVIKMGVPEDKITTVHNFIELEDYQPKYEPGEYFLYFGRVEKNKGVWPLVKAFESLGACKLLIVGIGSELQNLKRYCEGHPVLSGNVSFLGFMNRQELVPIIQNAFCTIVPSIWNETFGLTVAESLACGKPVIASRIGGIPEIVEDGEDAVLVEPNSPGAIVEAVEFLLKNRSSIAEMGAIGRSNIANKFSRERHYAGLVRVYEKAIK